MVDAPTDAYSRWSGLHENPSIKQWILLRLDTLSVIGKFLDSPSAGSLLKFAQDSITFGKVRAPQYLYARLPISSTPSRSTINVGILCYHSTK
jgi:hypothetical protein